MRRLTKPQPIAGACDWRAPSASAYSPGKPPGTVASSCATFISGPLRPPSARLSSAAFRSRSAGRPR